jgi:hypothetical protein
VPKGGKMFDYTVLIDQVRRLLGDNKIFTYEESTMQNTSYYITLANEGAIEIEDGAIVIDDEQVSSDNYNINGNIIKFNEPIELGSNVSIEYTYCSYSDDEIANFIRDTIENYISGLINTNYEIDGTMIDKDITFNEKSLFVHGTVLNIVGINILDVAGDSIKIKDGDTLIDTSVSSKDVGDAYNKVLSKFLYLLKTIRTNTFQGVVLYGE